MNRCICTHAPEQHGVIGCDVRSWSGKPCPCEWRPSAPRHDAGTGDEGVADVIADMERMASLSPATALPWRANIAAVSRLAADNARLKEERAAALSVTTREGLLASEWVLRTGLAERERDRLAARVAELEAAARGREGK